MKKYILEIIVFISGGVVMIFELVGSRLIAPYFGTSLYIWTSLIGVILGSLSLGYWLGGKLADKKPEIYIFASLLLFSGLSIGFVALIKGSILFLLHNTFPDPLWGSLLSSLFLFSIPSTLLGMVSPYAAKLKLHNLNILGSGIGSLYALSTLGSILGTFLAGFILIPRIGSTKIIFLLSLILIFLSVLVATKHILKTKLFFLFLFGTTFLLHKPFAEFFKQNGIFTFESAYNHITIYEAHDPKNKEEARILKINNEFSSAMYVNNAEDLVFDYTKFYRLAKHFNPNLKNALMLGGAGYSYPKDYLKNFPNSHIDVVEIDPKLTELAYEYFNLTSDPQLTIFHDDARVFINQTQNKYDVIFGDAFQSYHSIPFQLTTKEAVQKYYDLLHPDGFVIANIISAIDGDKGEFLRSELATFKSIFPQAYLFPVTNSQDGKMVQNIMLVAFKKDTPVSFTSSDKELETYLSHLWKKEVRSDLPILTDDYAPVDYYIKKLLNS